MAGRRRAWSRPHGAEIPNRPGDRDSHGLFYGLGRCISAWEGVQAQVSGLYMRLLVEQDECLLTQKLENFGRNDNVHKRACTLKDTLENFLAMNSHIFLQSKNLLRSKIKKLVEPYVEFAARRNEIAHGYVTECLTPDYSHPDQPIIRTYSLLPSHSRHHQWPHVEPEYNYRSSELLYFAGEFEKLDAKFQEAYEAVESIKA